MKKIQILLSTYNGEAYLREQLDSFAALDNFDEVKVLIRDDGSRDGTRGILKEYRERYGFDVILGENVGLNQSMFRLFLAADRNCSYFAYADQDDVWLPDKLTRAKAALDAFPEDSVALYSARSVLTDSAMQKIGQTIYPRRGASFYNAMVQNVAPGHSQVFTRALLELLSRACPREIYVIDHWMWLAATAMGETVLDPAATTLYRQHGKNVIGYGASRFSILHTRFRQVFRDVPRKHATQLSAFLATFGEEIPAPMREEAERFLAAQKRFGARFKYVWHPKIFRQQPFENFCFRLICLCGKYRTDGRGTPEK